MLHCIPSLSMLREAMVELKIDALNIHNCTVKLNLFQWQTHVITTAIPRYEFVILNCINIFAKYFSRNLIKSNKNCNHIIIFHHGIWHFFVEPGSQPLGNWTGCRSKAKAVVIPMVEDQNTVGFLEFLWNYLQNEPSNKKKYSHLHMIDHRLRSLWATWSTFHQF